MSVPETSIHENYFPMSRKHQIRLAGEGCFMKSESVAEGMNKLANDDFRTRVLS